MAFYDDKLFSFRNWQKTVFDWMKLVEKADIINGQDFDIMLRTIFKWSKKKTNCKTLRSPTNIFFSVVVGSL